MRVTRDEWSLLGLQPMRGILVGRRGGVVEITWTPESFWRLFETTGSVWAYLIYRQLVGRRQQWVVVPILN